jgi:hypothetical protein
MHALALNQWILGENVYYAAMTFRSMRSDKVVNTCQLIVVQYSQTILELPAKKKTILE